MSKQGLSLSIQLNDCLIIDASSFQFANISDKKSTTFAIRIVATKKMTILRKNSSFKSKK